MRLLKTAATALALATIALTTTACDDSAGASNPASVAATFAPEDPAVAALTNPQRNARRSAQDYLNLKGFSREGLIAQLSSEYGEGYSVADATAAVDTLTVNWNDNARRSAQDYLEMRGFSCSGLVEQLSSSHGEGFTQAQASYGAQAAGAC